MSNVRRSLRTSCPLGRAWPVAMAATMLVAFVLAGCQSAAPTTPQQDETVFYPQPPAPPRVQFLMSFADAATLTEEEGGFAEWIVGKQQETRVTEIAKPYGIAAHGSRLYVCDLPVSRIHVIDLADRTHRLLGEGTVRIPINITIQPDGTKYVVDNGVRRVLVFSPQDKLVQQFGMPGEWRPMDVVVVGEEVFVVDAEACQIQVFSKQGEHRRSISSKGVGPDQFRLPTNIAHDGEGRLYVTDMVQQIVKVFSLEGQFQGTLGGPGSTFGRFSRPKGITIDPAGRIYVADAMFDVVQLFDAERRLLMVFGGSGTEPYKFASLATVSVNKSLIPHLEQYLAPGFVPEYLVLATCQFGDRKVSIHAFGRSTAFDPSAYEVDPEQVERARQRLRQRAQEEQAEPDADADRPGPDFLPRQ